MNRHQQLSLKSIDLPSLLRTQLVFVTKRVQRRLPDPWVTEAYAAF